MILKKNIKKSTKILLIILLILTLIRILLAVKIPLYIQSNAMYDDELMVKYTSTILQGEYLGDFNFLTYAKVAGFPIFLAISYITGIPYSLFLILTYIIAIIVFIFAIKKIISNKYFLFFSYILLLFSPVMFHIENSQKIYRGGAIVVFSLLTVSAFIGLYLNRKENIKSILKWSLLSAFSLCFFYFLKEDSIWLVPFCTGVILITIFDILRSKLGKKLKKVIITTIPLISLLSVILIVCSIKYYKYGEFALTDRNGTYFKDVISDLNHIKSDNDNKFVWITKNMMYQAIDSSKTFKSIKQYIDNMYENSWALDKDGEIDGDIIYWTLKEAVRDAGIYDKGGKYVNDFYKKIHEELTDAFNNKKLAYETDKIYISKAARGYSFAELSYFKDVTFRNLKMIFTYDLNKTSLNYARGEENGITTFRHFINSNVSVENDTDYANRMNNRFIKVANIIVKAYQKLGIPMIIVSILGLILLIISSIKNKIKENVSILLILLGIVMTVAILLIGVEWFCSCFSNDDLHVYNYVCGAFPLIQIFELICIYEFIIIIKDKMIVKKR